VVNVLAPFAMQQISEELESVRTAWIRSHCKYK
jgi:hypothetical protein